MPIKNVIDLIFLKIRSDNPNVFSYYVIDLNVCGYRECSEKDIIIVNANKNQSYFSKNVIIATGGYPKFSSYHWIEQLGINVIHPVPSLFSFNAVKSPFAGLEGVSFDANFSIKGIHINITGPAIITHWGISGPAPLKLSAWAALELYTKKYEYEVSIHFCPQLNQSEIQNELLSFKSTNGKSKINKTNPFKIPARLYERLLIITGIDIQKNWGDVNKKEIAAVVATFERYDYDVIYYFGNENFENEIHSNYRHLMNYLDL